MPLIEIPHLFLFQHFVCCPHLSSAHIDVTTSFDSNNIRTSLPIPTSHLCYQVSELTPSGQHDSRVTTPASRHLIEIKQHWPSCPTQDTQSLDPMITPAALLPNRHFQLIHELALRLQPLVCVTIRSCRIYSRKHLGITVHRLHTCYPELGPHEAGDF